MSFCFVTDLTLRLNVSSSTATAFAQEQYGILSGHDLRYWEELFYAPPRLNDPKTPHGNTGKQPVSHSDSSSNNSSSDDEEYYVPLREGEEQRTYMYNVKTGSMIPSYYMLGILPEPQYKNCYEPG